MSYLYDNWLNIQYSYSSSSWFILNQAYSERHRAYHTWDHIETMLRRLDELQHLATAPNIIRSAIFWHDSVYNTGSVIETKSEKHYNLIPDSVNVIQSAELFMNHEKAKLSYYKNAVLSMILGTVDHIHASPTFEYYPGFSNDYKLFLDLDLSGFADSYDKFMENGNNIRKEFSFVSDEDFIVARKQIYMKFLHAFPLYKLPETNELWGKKAYDNLLKGYKDIK